MSGRVAIQATLNELPQGTVSIGPLTITPNTSNLCSVINTVLLSGTNQMAIPSWALGLIIMPNPSNATPMSVHTVITDAGIHLSQTVPSLISFDPANMPTQLYILTSGTPISETSFIFF